MTGASEFARSGTLRAIAFDIDGTLLDHRSSARLAVSRYVRSVGAPFEHLSAQSVHDRWRDAEAKWFPKYLAGELDFRAQRRNRMADLWSASSRSVPDDAQLDIEFAKYLAQYEKAWVGFPEVYATLDMLTRRCPLLVISNGDAQQQRLKLSRLGVSRMFTSITTSGEVGVSKPDPAIFRFAVSGLDCVPASVVYVGDDLNADYHGALNAGLRAVWLDRSAQPERPGIQTIHSLSDLPGALQLE